MRMSCWTGSSIQIEPRNRGAGLDLPSARVMSPTLGEAIRKVKEPQWKAFGTEADGTLRQWAEVDFVPGDDYESKDSRPLRYVGLRLLKPQGILFADGSDRHHHAVITNQMEKMDGGRLLQWHREKAGTVEHTHDEVKNELAGGRMPRDAQPAIWSQRGVVQALAAGLQRGQRDQRTVFGRGRADGATKEISIAGDSFGRTDESKQLRDGPAALRRCKSRQTHAEGLGSICAGHASDIRQGQRGGEAARRAQKMPGEEAAL